VEPDRRPQGNTAASKFERHHPTETETDRGNPISINSRLCREHVVTGESELACYRGVLEEFAETHSREIERVLAAATEVVESEREVPEPGETIGSQTNIVVLSTALVHQQHPRPIAASKLIIDSEVADHGNAKCFVLDPCGAQHVRDCKEVAGLDAEPDERVFADTPGAPETLRWAANTRTGNQPRPAKGIPAAITVKNSTLDPLGRLAM
jgi:hypothetical protein